MLTTAMAAILKMTRHESLEMVNQTKLISQLLHANDVHAMFSPGGSSNLPCQSC